MDIIASPILKYSIDSEGVSQNTGVEFIRRLLDGYRILASKYPFLIPEINSFVEEELEDPYLEKK
jgi:hypothetical protein